MACLRIGLSCTLLLVLAACGATSGGDRDRQAFARGSNAATNCSGSCATSVANPNAARLTVGDVKQVLAQAVAQARALNTAATIAVVDRVGNVLAVLRMPGVVTNGSLSVIIEGGASVISGLDGLKLPVADAVPCQNTTLDCAGLGIPVNAPLTIPGDGLAAIAKAITGAYLSSEGSGLSTRTASQIIQRHFNPGEDNVPSGPLFGVQFSQLPCSDFSRRKVDPGRVGPQRSPLGLAADSGGFPLYKNGTVVGGVGVISDDFIYGLDQSVFGSDRDSDELIALAATFDFAVPFERKATMVTVEGKTLRFSDAGFAAVTAAASNAGPLQLGPGNDGVLIKVRGYYDPAGGILQGTVFGQPASGIRPATPQYFKPKYNAFVFVDAANNNRYPPTASADPNGDGTFLSQTEVKTILNSALSVADQARAQIRRPHGSTARVTISVVDAGGNILGMVRTEDAPVFGADVSLQKARTATLFSSQDVLDGAGNVVFKGAAKFIKALPDAQYLTPSLGPAAKTIDLGDYVTAVRDFLGLPQALNDGTAFSDRAGGNLSRPNYPDGIDGNPMGPLSKPPGAFSIFSTGFQLDASFNALTAHLLFVFGKLSRDVGDDGNPATPPQKTRNCVGVPFGSTTSQVPGRLANGSQIFPGSVPIYDENGVLIGGIGVSGDGINQDDMISFLGLHRAGNQLGTIQNAPLAIRADLTIPEGYAVPPDYDFTRLRYVNCPESPFVNSDEPRACQGK